jgi:hypothetical protein
MCQSCNSKVIFLGSDWHIKTGYTQKYYFTVTWLTHQNWLYPKNITLLLHDWHIKTAYTQKIVNHVTVK